jgi:hypothetical protein
LQLPRIFLERTVQNLNEHIKGWISEIVFDLDEVGTWTEEDRKTTTVVVTAMMRGQTIHQGKSRKVKHVSVIVCVSAGRFATDLVMKSSANPYINAEIFHDYIRTVFLPNLAQLRRLDELHFDGI